ncbi:cytochrome c [Sulfitobacter sp. HNIBRBA2951]|uniref:c-type cytochrome n=1 Tax=Sulfitobacter aquimarinus TaxID=3158557 RepID=UPI0032DE9584
MKLSIFPVLVVLAGLSACTTSQPTDRGAQLYAANCVVCHGRTATGDGPMAASLTPRPANLTLLARSNGGVFPADDVIAQIYGYSGRHQLGGMPDFGTDLAGPTVDWTSATGEVIDTPRSLIDLVRYLEGIQQ